MTKPKQDRFQNEDEGQEPVQDVEVPVSDSMANLLETMEEMQGVAECVNLMRWNPERKRRMFVNTYPVEQFSFEDVRDTFGGGDYIAMFMKGNKILRTPQFSVDDHFPWRGPGSADAPVPHPVAAPLGNGGGEVAGLREVNSMQQQLVTQLIGALVTKAIAPAPAAAAGEGSLDTVIKLATLLRGSDTERLGVKDLAATFREGMELGKEIISPERSDSFADVVAPFVPLVKSTLEDYMELEKRKTANAASPPKVEGATAAHNIPQLAPTPPEVVVDLVKAPWLAHLAPFMGEIQTWARNGWDADRYVGSMIARMPDHIVDEIEVASRDPQFIENALAALPAPFLMFKGWLTQALESLREEVKQNETEGL